MGGVALHHLVVWLEASSRDLLHVELLVICLATTRHGGVCSQGIVDPRIGNQVGLELVEVNVESSFKPKAGGDGGDDLSDETVEVGVGRSVNLEVRPGDVINCLIVHQEGAVAVLQGGVSVEDCWRILLESYDLQNILY